MLLSWEKALSRIGKHTERVDILLHSFIEHFYTLAFLPYVSQETLFLHVVKTFIPPIKGGCESEFVVNKAKGRIWKRVFQEIKDC